MVMSMRKKVTLSLVVLLLVVLGAGGAVYWSGLIGESLHPLPDRTELITAYILEKWPADSKDLSIVKCKQVRRGEVEEARRDHPSFEIVDCTYRTTDVLGNEQEQTRNFW